jgi:FtsH-binding integral membrane protein
MNTQISSSGLPAKTTGRHLPSLWMILVALGGVGLAIVFGLAFAAEDMDTALPIGFIFVLVYSLVAGGVWLAYRLVRDLHQLGKLRMFFGVGIPLFLVAWVGYALWRANGEHSTTLTLEHLVGGAGFATASWYAFGRFLKR